MMCVTRDSNMILGSKNGNSQGTGSIELLTIPNTLAAERLEFMREIAVAWTSYTSGAVFANPETASASTRLPDR